MITTAGSVDGTPIVFERRGAGPVVVVVVVVAGAGNDRYGDEPLVAELTAEFSVVTSDPRRRGDSGDTAPYAVEREIEDLAAVVASLGEPVIVHGISSGGALALLTAAAGVPMARLSVFEPPYRGETEEAPEGSSLAWVHESPLPCARRKEGGLHVPQSAPDAPAQPTKPDPHPAEIRDGLLPCLRHREGGRHRPAISPSRNA
ncbi:MAG TPA: alpha/beta fold hydrolase [Amycolatopsis sp.]|nr:alpha/beta fold hydrolase [Amycolatopsis sp.]